MEFPAFEWIRISRKWILRHGSSGNWSSWSAVFIHLPTDRSSCARVLACFSFFFEILLRNIAWRAHSSDLWERCSHNQLWSEYSKNALALLKYRWNWFSRPRYRGLCPSSYVASSSGRHEMTVSDEEPCIIRKWNLCIYLVSVVILTFRGWGWNLMMLPFKWNFFSSTFTWYYYFIQVPTFESVDEILWCDHSIKWNFFSSTFTRYYLFST